LVKVMGAKGNYLLAASQNRGALKIFELKRDARLVKIQPMDQYATIKYKNGKISKQEFYYGDSFLSQSGRYINIDSSMASVTVTDNYGHTRNLAVN